MNETNAAQIGRSVMGTSLIGAKGKTPEDQQKINETAAGACGVGSWTQTECSRHRTEIAQ